MTTGARIREFDLWQHGYGGLAVTVYVSGTTTLASIYSDLTLETPLANPQTLESRTFTGFSEAHGRWAQPIYTGSPYYLRISNGERTGIETPPLSSMEDVDISLAVASARHGETEIAITDWLERTIDVFTYGEFSDDVGATNSTETLNTAIGVAAAQGGGYVLIPAGSVEINPVTLPQGVVLRGAGISATTLRCQTTGVSVITIGGDGAGIQDLVVDGVTVPSNSYGVDAIARNSVVFENAMVRRYETGVRIRGGEGHRWRNFSVASCGTGALLAGDLDTASTGLGAQFAHCTWIGGAVAFNTVAGLELKAIDALCTNIALHGVQFEANLDESLLITGARDVRLNGCWWHANLTALTIQDNDATPDADINTASRVYVVGGFFDGDTSGSSLVFNGECDLVRFQNVDFINCDFDLSVPEHVIVLEDCKRDADTTTQGLTQFLLAKSSDDGGQNVGTTAGATTVTAFTELVPPGETWIMDAKVVGKRTNGTARGSWWITATIDRPAATLAYINLASAFTVGLIVTGTTSGASARIVGDSAGTLTLIDITGTFINNEIITDTSTGEARVSGTLNTTDAVLAASGNEAIKTATDGFSGATVAFAPNGPNAELQLTGVASHNINWSFTLNIHKSV